MPPKQGQRSQPAQKPELSHSRVFLLSNKEELRSLSSWCKATPLLSHFTPDVAILEGSNMSWISSELHLL